MARGKGPPVARGGGRTLQRAVGGQTHIWGLLITVNSFGLFYFTAEHRLSPFCMRWKIGLVLENSSGTDCCNSFETPLFRTSTPPPPPQKSPNPPPPPKTKNLMGMGVFQQKEPPKNQAPVKLAQSFPAPELRAEKLQT